MCGIYGYCNRKLLPDATAAGRVMERIGVRGPDEHDSYRDDAVLLMHARLSIIGLQDGLQPMKSLDGRYVLIYNGEVFHYQDLRNELIAAGVDFRTGTDTEVLMQLLIREGTSALSRINGFFAFALYDRLERTILFARDRLGIKPLFYYRTDDAFAFSSRIDALRVMPDCPSATDGAALAEYLCFQYIGAPRTIFEGVHKVMPGTWGRYHIDSGKLESGAWWSMDEITEQDTIPYAKLCEELAGTMRDAVRTRLVADVPVGVYLSGGLDSAIIAALAAEQSSSPVDCYSIGFPDRDYDESGLAADTAEFLGRKFPGKIRHHVRTVEPDDFGVFENLARDFGEPYADASMLPYNLLSRFVREQGTKVALSGDGADELFGGYERCRAMGMLRKMSFVPPALLQIAGNLMNSSAGERTQEGRTRRFLKLAALGDDPSRQYDALMSHEITELLEYIAPDLANVVPSHHFRPGRDFANSIMRNDLRHYLPGDILPKADVASMNTALEVRSPFLDCRVAGFALGLPSKYKIEGKIRKKILGDTFRDVLPPDLPSRKKRGFGVPMADWLRTSWRDRARAVIMDETLPAYPCISPRAVEIVLDDHSRGRDDHSYLIFALLMLGLHARSL